MTQKVAEFFKNVTESCGNQEIDVRDSYSGRGMFGRTTYGVVVSSVPTLLADTVQFLKETLADNPQFEIPDMEDFRTDNMANQTILY